MKREQMVKDEDTAFKKELESHRKRVAELEIRVEELTILAQVCT